MIFRPSQVALDCTCRTLESTLKAQPVQSQDPQEHAESLRANR
ncbi:hypothetical protein GQ55_2G447800 [Panicum hallii var. hallii]|uniref:Uncharacterized protein n=2 Tax=Panicum hallii TaxID=206008 RepID=A0A2T7EZ51_9POAL|nr:hypothetical protein GQ55_2G447800 [Panicum hallii var. hallii]